MKKKMKLLQDIKDFKKYDHLAIESKWQAKWEKEKVYQPDLGSAKRPFYTLMMFPYPSAEGLHIGGVRTFSGVDIYGRFKRMQGYDVFEPIGLDALGIHSENYALKVDEHPMTLAKVLEKRYYKQLQDIGNGFAWDQKLETNDPDYYRWTQWIFVQMFKHGLAYRKKARVNWCTSCKTVLADEQVVNGRCERCDSEVIQKDLDQWFFRITQYANRLLANIETLDWSEIVKIAQRQWIGKSEGARIRFVLRNISGQEDNKHTVDVFSTRPDTLYGATFLVISPELGKKWLEVGWRASDEVVGYIEKALKKDQIARIDEKKEKTGVDTGIKAVNPVNKEEVSVWVADYVLGGYGTGAIMAVPAHDERDYAFARKFNLPIKVVIESANRVKDEAYTGSGRLINSEEWNGWEMPADSGKVIDWLENNVVGTRETTYHLRDWLISRQRYWGPPIPMIYCESCASEKKGEREDMPGWYTVPEGDLPVVLPKIKNFRPLGTGKSPLASVKSFYETVCPACKRSARRETDVSDTFLDSAWYFLRYPSVSYKEGPWDRSLTKKWLPVSIYIGGAEHSVLHLLYSRFLTMVFSDWGLVGFEEPFPVFRAHGLITKDGAKMSKSKGNVVSPDEYIRLYGADVVRMYLAFLAPFEQGGDFRDSGIEGMNRFLKRVWTLFRNVKDLKSGALDNKERLRMMHGAIRGVSEDIEGLRYNTAIAKLMIWYNFLVKQDRIYIEEAEVYLKLLAPFAPHITEELFQQFFGNSKFESIHMQGWPTYDAKYLEEDVVTVAVQVNGKMRGTIQDQRSKIKDQSDAEELAWKSEKLRAYLEGKKVRKVIYVAGKVINFVVGD